MWTMTYIALVEVAARQHRGRSEALASLIDYDPVVGVSERGWVQVRLTISATGLAHACTTAAALARVATGAEAIACEVMTDQEYASRNAPARHASYGAPILPRQGSELPLARPSR